MTETGKVRIPRHPSIYLQTGKQTHWRNVSRAKAEDTQDMAWLARAAGLNPTMPWSRCSVTVQFISPVKRRRDRDNWLGRMKGFFDGLSQVGVWTDDNADVVTRADVEFVQIKGEQPATIIMITKEE